MVSGIIAEFNIFHNGHAYLIGEAKKQSDVVVCVMSGSFVQRGEAAITDKWSRTNTAIMCGADLVLELPVCYALSAAPNFAAGGVNTLAMLGIDTLVFGSECGDMDALKNTADVQNENDETVKKHLSEGMSYPAALGRAYGDTPPNDILAVEYIRAIQKYGCSIKPTAVKRMGAKHDSISTHGKFASASKIREMLINGGDISEFIPYPVSEIGLYPHLTERLDTAIAARLRTMSAEELSNISEVSEGLENRILSAAAENSTFKSICECTKSKRYTMSRIKRILIAALLGYEKDIYTPFPDYIRLLGMNQTGSEFLKKAKSNCPVPIITKTADFKEKRRMFSLDLRATDIFSLSSPDINERKSGADFRHSPVIIRGGNP